MYRRCCSGGAVCGSYPTYPTCRFFSFFYSFRVSVSVVHLGGSEVLFISAQMLHGLGASVSVSVVQRVDDARTRCADGSMLPRFDHQLISLSRWFRRFMCRCVDDSRGQCFSASTLMSSHRQCLAIAVAPRLTYQCLDDSRVRSVGASKLHGFVASLSRWRGLFMCLICCPGADRWIYY